MENLIRLYLKGYFHPIMYVRQEAFPSSWNQKSDITFIDCQGTILAILSSTGECLEVEDRTADIIKTGNLGNLADYEVYDIKKGYKYIQTVRRQDIDNDLPF